MTRKNDTGQFTLLPTPKGNLVKEATGEQHPERRGLFLDHSWWYGTSLYANGGSYENPMGFPGYHGLYTGTYQTYRWMLQHPVLRLVRAISTCYIHASTWEYDWSGKREGPKEWMDLVSENFNNLRHTLMADYFLRGRDYGWAGGELIYEYREGNYWIDRVKPLQPDITEILRDKNGNFVGLRNQVYNGDGALGVDIMAPYKSWIYSHDSESGYLYGRGWLENVRSTAWKEWLDCAQQLQKLGAKIAGVVSIIKSPAGTFPGPPDADGNPTTVSYQKSAEAAIKALASGASGLWFPSLGLAPDSRGGLDAMKVLVELAGKSLTNIEVVDFGSNAAAIGPILDRMKHAEEQMFNGGLRSARTGLEAQHGTKAEAGIHTDTGTVVSEVDDTGFAVACQPLLDAVLTLNFGDKAKGRIRIKPPSLMDRKAQILRALLLSLLNVPEVVGEVVSTVDMNKLFETLDVSLLNGKSFDAESVKTAIQEAKKQKGVAPEPKGSPEPQGGRPKGT